MRPPHKTCSGRLRRGCSMAAGLAILLVTGWLPEHSRAEPAPLPEEEMHRLSDLIIECEVLSVARVRGQWGHYYLAQLRIDKVIKGRPPSNPLPYTFVPPAPGLLGELNSVVYAGEKLKLYLIIEPGWKYYDAWQQSGIVNLTDFPESRRILPEQDGQIIYADGSKGVVSSDSGCCCRRRLRLFR